MSLFSLRNGLSLVVSLAVLVFATAAFAGPPTDFVKSKSETLFSIVNEDPGPARTTKLKKEARTLVNYSILAKRSLGKHWTARSPEERKTFISLLEELVEINYADRFQQKAKDAKYKVDYLAEKVRESSKMAIVKTKVSYGKESFTLDYKLLNTKKGSTNSFIIFDTVFDDISLEETYRASYVPIIEKEGWASLITRMENKLKESK